jgi:hypothetical protein
MRFFFIAVLLSGFFAVPAVAADADAQGSIGENFSAIGAFGIQGEFNIPSRLNNTPDAIQIFWKKYYRHPDHGVSWDITGYGAAAIYDFNSIAGLDNRIQPYVGIGLMSISQKWTGTGPARTYTGVGSGLYLAVGIRYLISTRLATDLNYNLFTGPTAGINLSF